MTMGRMDLLNGTTLKSKTQEEMLPTDLIS